MKDKYIFLNKDGTIIFNVPYNVDISKIRFHEDVIPVLQVLAEAHYKFIMVSNQPGIAHGYFNKKQLRMAMKYITDKLRSHQIYIEAFYYCPLTDLPAVTTCYHSKPFPQLILKAAEDYHIDLNESWMIGNLLSDIGAGNDAGCKTIFLDRNAKEHVLQRSQICIHPDYIENSFYGVLKAITDQGRSIQ